MTVGWKRVLKKVPFARDINFFRQRAPYYVRMALARLGVVSRPEVVMLELTNACNLKCVMCGTPSAQRKTGLMSWDIYVLALEQAAALGVGSIVLHTTGESLLHRELARMVREAKTRGFKTMLSTNGILLDERRATDLLDAGLDQLRFSIEGANKATYEAVRVGGNHERLVTNMRRLRDLRDSRGSGMGIAVNSVYMKETAGEVAEFMRVYGPLSDYIEFSHLGNQGNHMPEIVLRSSTKPRSRGSLRPCSLLWRSIVVSWNGDVTVCCVDLENEMVVGNITRQPLAKIWRSEPYTRYRQQHLQGRQDELKLCSGCSAIKPHMSPYRQFRLNSDLKTAAAATITNGRPGGDEERA
jgi:radical SAM protein with 4Fe4S-binding SPASM domain